MASGEPRSQQVDFEEIIDSMKQRVRDTDRICLNLACGRSSCTQTIFVPRNC